MTLAADIIPSELLDAVVAHFKPQRVIVFGSAARGSAHQDSDIDLLVVLDDDVAPEMLSARSIHEARQRYSHPVDILPCRASILRERAQARGSFADIVLREGIIVYDRG